MSRANAVEQNEEINPCKSFILLKAFPVDIDGGAL